MIPSVDDPCNAGFASVIGALQLRYGVVRPAPLLWRETRNAEQSSIEPADVGRGVVDRATVCSHVVGSQGFACDGKFSTPHHRTRSRHLTLRAAKEILCQVFNSAPTASYVVCPIQPIPGRPEFSLSSVMQLMWFRLASVAGMGRTHSHLRSAILSHPYPSPSTPPHDVPQDHKYAAAGTSIHCIRVRRLLNGRYTLLSPPIGSYPPLFRSRQPSALSAGLMPTDYPPRPFAIGSTTLFQRKSVHILSI